MELASREEQESQGGKQGLNGEDKEAGQRSERGRSKEKEEEEEQRDRKRKGRTQQHPGLRRTLQTGWLSQWGLRDLTAAQSTLAIQDLL